MKTLLAAAGLALAFCVPATAQIGQGRGPIDITADETVFLNDQRVARWIGRVDVRQGDARMLADQMDVHFSQGGDGAGEITRIVAVGDVSYIGPEEIARGDRGVYQLQTDQIELTGNVTLVRGRDTLTGERLIIEPSIGRARIVGRSQGRASDAEDRVRSVFYPEDEAGADGDSTDE